MKKYGTYTTIALALVLMTALSVLYWQDVGLKAAAASSSVNSFFFILQIPFSQHIFRTFVRVLWSYCTVSEGERQALFG